MTDSTVHNGSAVPLPLTKAEPQPSSCKLVRFSKMKSFVKWAILSYQSWFWSIRGIVPTNLDIFLPQVLLRLRQSRVALNKWLPLYVINGVEYAVYRPAGSFSVSRVLR